LVDDAIRRDPGPFALQAAISAVHCRAARAHDTDWQRILGFYDLLQRVQPSPVVALNRAVAVAMSAGPGPALALVDELVASGALDGYHLLHSTRAELLRRLGSMAEAANAYAKALEFATNDSERRFLERRLREVRTAN
jgi:RNA polymerase sigma-70 factor (ECF subfamily)